MQPQLEIQFEIEPIVPDTPASVKSYFNTALRDALQESQLDRSLTGEPRIVYEQRLPLTKEQVEIATIVVAFVLKEAPNIWYYMKTFFELLSARLSQKAPMKVSCKLQIGDKKVEVTGLSLTDTAKIITEKYEMELRPHKRPHQ